MNSRLSPVVLFVYARPDHTLETINALSLNPEAKNTDLIIYSDASRNSVDTIYVDEVRSIIKNISGFKSVTLNIRNENYGLAKNIMEGVSEVMLRYDSAIILEDDIVTSRSFLSFMNKSLMKYKTEAKVWHISGWNYPIKHYGDVDSFFWRGMNCWGWATWSDRWREFTKDPDLLVETWSKNQIKRFNIDGGYNFWSQVLDNKNKKINTWAIFWYATIFSNNGLCLNPTRSYVNNIGVDGSGENCDNMKLESFEINNEKDIKFPTEIKENIDIVDAIKYYHKRNKPSLYRRILYKLRAFYK